MEQEDEHAAVRAQVFRATAGPGLPCTNRLPRRCNAEQTRRPRTYLGDRADEEDRAWDTRLQMMGILVLEEASAELAGTTTTDLLVPPSKYNRDPEETTAQVATSLRAAYDGFREIRGLERIAASSYEAADASERRVWEESETEMAASSYVAVDASERREWHESEMEMAASSYEAVDASERRARHESDAVT